MFHFPHDGDYRRTTFLALSFAAHGGVILLLLLRAPIFVKPSSVAWGLRGQSDALVYTPRRIGPASSPKKLLAPVKSKPALKPPPPDPETARAGSPGGSLFHGPVTGSEALPALPLVFPDPVIYPWQLSNGLQGDVIVEVTIDDHAM